MAYFLEALIFDATDIEIADLTARVVPLWRQLSLLPLTDEVKAAGGSVTSTNDSVSTLPPELESWARRRSKRGPVGYIVAEYFGGCGGQFSLVWWEREIVLGPLRQPDAINQTLRRFGVKAGDGKDEFDTVELGRHRHTDQWV